MGRRKIATKPNDDAYYDRAAYHDEHGGRMPGNMQQPIANFGYGNNMNFYGANMGNNMGYGQGNGNMNNF